MSSTQDLREKAQRCRRLAASIDDQRAREGLIELAERYEAEAEAEASQTPPKPPQDDAG